MFINRKEFEDIVSSQLKEISPAEADELIEAKAGHAVFVGRSTCSYCRLFLPKLAEAAESRDEAVYYVNSEDPDQLAEVDKFRGKYQLYTVPSLVYSDQAGLVTKSDSSLSVEEIAKIIN